MKESNSPESARTTTRPDWVPVDAGPAFATSIVSGSQTEGTAPKGLYFRRRSLSVDEYVAGVLDRNSTILGRAISLIESNVPAHQRKAQQVLSRLLPHTGRAMRIGITGIPGAGKSTFIEAFGCNAVDSGKRIAVLAIDPSSSVTGGSILADKIRMEKLCQRREAFIRPSPSGGSLGGVTRKTREAILLCEAAGFEIVIVETVGVGQNEIAVHSMVDFYLNIMIAGAGDEMQGIKKGVIELADALVINKADGDNHARATATYADMKCVVHYLRQTTEGWETPVLMASALYGNGVPEVWTVVNKFFAYVQANGLLAKRRQKQAVEWMHALIAEELCDRFYLLPAVRSHRRAIECSVAEGQTTALAAALDMLQLSRETDVFNYGEKAENTKDK